jgi:hypothetical protein
MMSAAPFTPKEVDDLADRLMLEFDERFEATDLDLMIGRMRWFWPIGIGLEINGEWDSFVAARRSLFWPPRWTIPLDQTHLSADPDPSMRPLRRSNAR